VRAKAIINSMKYKTSVASETRKSINGAFSKMGKKKKLTISEVKEAYEEWQAAKNFFENVHDPELVDVAIFGAEAARRRYLYMLKLVRIYEEEDKLENIKKNFFEKNDTIALPLEDKINTNI